MENEECAYSQDTVNPKDEVGKIAGDIGKGEEGLGAADDGDAALKTKGKDIRWRCLRLHIPEKKAGFAKGGLPIWQ